MGLKVRKSCFGELLIAWLSATVTIILFYSAHGIDNGTYFIAITDAFFKSLTMVIVFSILASVTRSSYISGATMFLLVNILYNHNSVLRYAVSSLYEGSISNNSVRFLGGLYVNFILIIAALIWRRQHLRNQEFQSNDEYGVIENLRVSPWIACSLALVYLMIEIYSLFTTGSPLASNSTRMMSTVVKAMECICITLATLTIKKGKIGYKPISLIPAAIILLTVVIVTMSTGSKRYLVGTALVMVCCLIFQKKLEFARIRYLLYLSPLALQGITNLSEAISGRWGDKTSWGLFTLRYHVFRYDLSDLATTMSLRYWQSTNKLKLLTEALQQSIPSAIYKNKPESLEMYKANIHSMGLEMSMDFNDTFFSMGAQLGGFVGMLIFFVLVVLFFEWISRRIIRIKKIGPAILMTFMEYFSWAESDINMFIYHTRDLILYLFFSWIIFRLLVHKI